MTRKLLITLLPLITAFLLNDTAFGQKDTISVKPSRGSLCYWDITIKNRNAAGTAIDEIKFTVTSADGTIIQDFASAPGSRWTAFADDNSNAHATSDIASANVLAGQDKLIGTLGFDIPFSSFDKTVTVEFITKNSTNEVTKGTLNLICTPTQGNVQDSFTVSPSLSGSDPCFDFTVFYKNGALDIHRFIAKLITPGGGTMRPSKVTPPSGWALDSVTTLAAYFSASAGAHDIRAGESVSGFKVCLRGNPTINKFDFAVTSSDGNNVQISRDTLRNIPITFTGSSTDADVVSAAIQSGCLYGLTVKNYHVSNSQLISRIRKVVLWSKTAGVTFSAAPSAPLNWDITLKSDSVIYTANADSAGIPSGKVESSFKFSVDGPTTSGFKIGWNTYRDLTTVLSTGEISLTCSKDKPRKDTATIETTQNCCYTEHFSNLHNTPPSDLKALQVAIPTTSGKLTNPVINAAGWDVTTVNNQTIRFTAQAGTSVSTGATADVSFCLDPTTPGQNIALTWTTYDAAAITSGNATTTGTHTIGCAPVVEVPCDKVSFVPVQGDTCGFNYKFQNLRDTVINNISFEMLGGWTADTAIAPTGWKAQLQNGKRLVQYTPITADGGIAKNTTLDGFIVKYYSYKKLDTFFVVIKRVDPNGKSCIDIDTIETCKTDTTPVVSVEEKYISKASVTVYPNPAKQEATLDLTVEHGGRVYISLLDILGHEISMLSRSILEVGEHHFPFSMKSLAPGSYYVRIKTLNDVITQKVIRVE